ncbi:hypothetical protein [Nonomuraea jabiensis]|uniref:hypothetical protein n=1 Tax=Nonomuraea jabiensis TaxID=882448 RepID=UPI0036953D46
MVTEKPNPLVGGGVKIWPLNDDDAPPAILPPCVAGIYLRISDDDEGLELGVKRQDADVPKPRPDYDRLMADTNGGELHMIVH